MLITLWPLFNSLGEFSKKWATFLNIWQFMQLLGRLFNILISFRDLGENSKFWAISWDLGEILSNYRVSLARSSWQISWIRRKHLKEEKLLFYSFTLRPKGNQSYIKIAKLVHLSSWMFWEISQQAKNIRNYTLAH